MASRDPRIDTLIEDLVAYLVALTKQNVQRVISEVLAQRQALPAKRAPADRARKQTVGPVARSQKKKSAAPKQASLELDAPIDKPAKDKASKTESARTPKSRASKRKARPTVAKRSAEQLSLF